jgi:dienelactone hydrolase
MATSALGPRPAPARRYLDPVGGLLARVQATAAPVEAPRTPAEWATWRERTLQQVLAALGPFPERVPLDVEVTERHDHARYTRERVLYQSEAYATVPAWLLVPKGIAPGERRPGVLCAHGHGRGKDDPAGVLPAELAAADTARAHVQAHNYDYARQLVERGYVCLVPDWRGFGERRAPAAWVRDNRDACNVLYLAYGYLGFQLLALDVWDAMRSVDVLCQLPYVDSSRIGMVGLSFGGTMTTYVAALDERVRCAVISCYLSTIRDDALGERGRANTCGSQFLRGLLTFGDVATVAGLIAPRPCLVEIGREDTCFVVDDALRSYADLARIYAGAGRREHLDSDVHPGPHAFSGAKAFDWLARWLPDGAPAGYYCGSKDDS